MLDASVIISTRNRAELLRQTLEHLTAQKTEGLTWELIVADNGSSDETQTVLEQFKERLPLKTLYVAEPGKNRALNQAIELAEGELYIFTDDDVIPCDSWIAELVAASKRWPDDSIFGGPIIPKFPPGTPDWLASPDFRFAAIAFGRNDPGPKEGPSSRIPYGANVALRRRVFLEYGFRNDIGPTAGEYVMGSEAELLFRLKRDSYRIIVVPSATVDHVVDARQTTMEWLFARAYRSGRGKGRIVDTNGKPQLFGIPCHWWRQYVSRALAYGCSLFGSSKRRCVTGMAFYSMRGRIAERMRLYRDRTNETGGSSLRAQAGAGNT